MTTDYAKCLSTSRTFAKFTFTLETVVGIKGNLLNGKRRLFLATFFRLTLMIWVPQCLSQ